MELHLCIIFIWLKFYGIVHLIVLMMQMGKDNLGSLSVFWLDYHFLIVGVLSLNYGLEIIHVHVLQHLFCVLVWCSPRSNDQCMNDKMFYLFEWMRKLSVVSVWCRYVLHLRFYVENSCMHLAYEVPEVTITFGGYEVSIHNA